MRITWGMIIRRLDSQLEGGDVVGGVRLGGGMFGV